MHVYTYVAVGVLGYFCKNLQAHYSKAVLMGMKHQYPSIIMPSWQPSAPPYNCLAILALQEKGLPHKIQTVVPLSLNSAMLLPEERLKQELGQARNIEVSTTYMQQFGEKNVNACSQNLCKLILWLAKVLLKLCFETSTFIETVQTSFKNELIFPADIKLWVLPFTNTDFKIQYSVIGQHKGNSYVHFIQFIILWL